MSKGRYSKYIRPISIALDFLVLTVLVKIFLNDFAQKTNLFIVYQLFSWTVIAYFTAFYEVYRFTKPAEILSKLVKQFILFTLVVIAYFSVVREIITSFRTLLYFIGFAFLYITLFKGLLFYYLKKYRIILGGNYRNAIIIGYSESAKNLQNLFDTRHDYGYRFKGFFSDKITNDSIVGKVHEIEDFVIKNKIDDIYCVLKELDEEQMKKLVEFADYHQCTIKFIPEADEIYSKNLVVDYYEFFPILSLKRSPLNELLNKAVKRSFDVFFSFLIIVLILSWLIPLIAILIKLESKGPIFFKQGRPGLNQDEFFCYKFRSMRLNSKTEEMTTKNDPRVTQIGSFLRRTSLDEMPQFFNVLFGDMSIVGPRPHLWSHNNEYQKKIKKYNVRLHVRPGITGLAQVKGYRGEIETDDEMVNRIKFDVFYIENWSFFLDIKIIALTVINIFKGQEKAY
ncbi:undecaprenyl-phosphate glucose phosphotransferase [Flavobacterium amnicola]|uniref:Undecaprenyl-phosphate glucose phosphotransferase n=1 Tax=Flavobacterium amnicola TaxID=2506422 RepID=A0A4Q1K8N4_9FLAO|nr:undecaprenyl-phosphate glucose phosphotransferase [Flavobacterium amnicola]RXR20939.1 undecaprenyl-phosphate glucose phosphotransferase [Flavobacterium amnicola]